MNEERADQERGSATHNRLCVRAKGGAMPREQRTILLIDDEQQLLNMHKMILEESGYLVLTANSGRQGLKLLSTCTVDEVVLDYDMPEMDGGRVAAEIKKTRPELPVLMLSGQEVPESALQFVDGFVSKGNAPTFLQLAIRQLLPYRVRRKPVTETDPCRAKKGA
jgi:CheY-like chemotaxis protein